MKKTRTLFLDIFDYDNNKICSLFDSSVDQPGQAYEVTITTERNGWKQLTFNVPSTYIEDNKNVYNYRLDYIKPDFRIRAIDDYETDWFLITTPSFKHSGSSNSVSVTAGHVCQLLKTKNLGLVFSDDEGNNIGTAKELLDTILDGTGWTSGTVTTFYEDYDPTSVKVRSLSAGAKTGAFKLISNMCDLFEAKPVYHGDTKTVDILPMNPFSKKFNGVPDLSSADEILELCYNKNLKNVTRKLDNSNLVTKLYAYGSYGDADKGYCGIDEEYHTEYTFTVDTALIANNSYYFTILDDSGTSITRSFVVDRNVPVGSKIVFSLFDPCSMSYVWVSGPEETFYDVKSLYWSDLSDDLWESIQSSVNVNGHAYFVEEGNTSTSIELSTPTKDSVKNWFSYLMDFEYFQDCNLITDYLLQKIAGFQRFASCEYSEIYNESNHYNESLNELTSTIGSIDFMKLYNPIITEENDGSSYLILQLNKTDDYPDGIEYRTDYDLKASKQFKFVVTDSLKSNGDPVNSAASMLMIIYPMNDHIKYKKCYLKAVNNTDDPTVLTFHLTRQEYYEFLEDESSYCDFYIFKTNGINGTLGAYEVNDEATVTLLSNQLKTVTVKHDVVFTKAESSDDFPAIQSIKDSDSTTSSSDLEWYNISDYGWLWNYSDDVDVESKLYFCYYQHYDDGTDTTWMPVFYKGEEPDTSNPYTTGTYWFDYTKSKLYRFEDSAWRYLDSDDEKDVASNFTVVYKNCYNRDRYRKGISRYCSYTVPDEGALTLGNYYMSDEYNGYHVFSTDTVFNSGDTLCLDNNNKYIDVLKTENFNIIASHDPDEESSIVLYKGSINTYGEDVNDDYTNANNCRSNYIEVTPGSTYTLNGLNEGYYCTIYKYQSYENLKEETVYNFVDSVKDIHGDKSAFEIDSDITHIRLMFEVAKETMDDVSFEIMAGTKTIIETKSYSFDNVEYHSTNCFNNKFKNGYIDNTTGSETDSTTYCVSTGYTKIVPNSTYSITEIEDDCYVHIYNYNKTWKDCVKVSNGTFTVNEDIYYVRLCIKNSSATVCDNYSINIHSLLFGSSIIIDDVSYINLTPIVYSGNRNGILYLYDKFYYYSDYVYDEIYNTLKTKQNALNSLTSSFSNALGDMYREGYLQKNDYVDGDEQKLYNDAIDSLKKIAIPESTYTIDYVDMYSIEDSNYYSSDSTYFTAWPDLTISSAVHLVDEDLDVNCWAYVDKITKCYDVPSKTTIAINTNLTTISQHSFADVMTNIANVASSIKGKESIIDRASYLSSSGSVSANLINGTLNVDQISMVGGSTTWYTNSEGNMVFESADGNSAMTLTGFGFNISDSKDEFGDWNWKTFGTGSGLSSEAIQAKSITVDKLASNVGAKLDISSNESIILAAKTAESLINSYISIDKNNIDIYSGSNINIEAGASLNIKGGSLVVDGTSSVSIKTPNFSLDATGISNVKTKNGTAAEQTINLYTDLWKLNRGIKSYSATTGILTTYDGTSFSLPIKSNPVLLWTNENSATSYSGGLISLSDMGLSNINTIDMFYIIARDSCDYNFYNLTFIPNTQLSKYSISDTNNKLSIFCHVLNAYRYITISSDGITFDENGYRTISSTTEISKEYCIPHKILGVKI